MGGRLVQSWVPASGPESPSGSWGAPGRRGGAEGVGGREGRLEAGGWRAGADAEAAGAWLVEGTGVNDGDALVLGAPSMKVTVATMAPSCVGPLASLTLPSTCIAA